MNTSSSLFHTPFWYRGSRFNSETLLKSISVIGIVGNLYLAISEAQIPSHFAEGTVKSRRCAAPAEPETITIAICSP